jgi:hypothetical protein
MVNCRIELCMITRLGLLVLHVALLAFASTGFTVVTGIGDGRYLWEYYRYSSHSGWGVTYQPTYSLQIVLAYLAAYATGVTAYSVVYRSGSKIIGLAGLLLCIVGFASFTFELSHWFVDHSRSWIVSAPIALFVLAPAAAVHLYRQSSTEPTSTDEHAAIGSDDA